MIVAATPADIAFFGQLINYAPAAGARGIKLVVDNEIHAMVVYDNWTPAAVQMHVCIANHRHFNRAFIREALLYPFEQCGRELLVGVTPGDNTAALDFNRRIGFVEKYRIRDGWKSGVDMVVQELRKGDCKWLRPRATVQPAGAIRPTSHLPEVVNG